MLIPFSHKEKPPTYKEFKSKKFNDTEQKIRTMLSNINNSSLKTEDKHRLLMNIQSIINDYAFVIK